MDAWRIMQSTFPQFYGCQESHLQKHVQKLSLISESYYTSLYEEYS
jgi:hypothetical protein